MDRKDFIGRIIETDIGNLKVKQVKYSGLGTGPGGEVIKHVCVITECGSEFRSTLKELEHFLVNQTEE